MQHNKMGLNHFARMMQMRMEGVDTKPPLLDFGEIMPDGSLKTNLFGIQIPKSDYLACQSLTYDPANPMNIRYLRAGDRVLVAWVGNDAVVIDRIVSVTEVM